MKPRPALAKLVRRPDIAACFRILGADACRLVGGAVRDALLALPTGDIDFAARLAPRETLARLAAADIRALETGIAHGGVTALFPETRIEITRLRRDAETDGRHARIAPVSAWEEDARRRDFTVNALYADAAGRLYDPLGTGESDLRVRRVRFIGASTASPRLTAASAPSRKAAPPAPPTAPVSPASPASASAPSWSASSATHAPPKRWTGCAPTASLPNASPPRPPPMPLPTAAL